MKDEPIFTFEKVMEYLSTLLAGIGMVCTFMVVAFLLGYCTSPSQI
jgi:hypothetical protein